MAPVLVGLTLAEEPATWEALGFSVGADGVAAVGGVRLRLAGAEEGEGIVAWTLSGVGGGDLHGLPTEATDAPPAAPAEHPNGAVAVDHVVALTGDFAAASATLVAAGLDLRRVREVPGGDGVRQGFFPLGTSLLELAGPVPGRDRTGFWGLTVAVRDLDALAARLGDRLGAVTDAVQPGRRIATLRREAGASLPVAFMTPRRATAVSPPPGS